MDDEFLSYLDNCYLIIFYETWGSDRINLPGFEFLITPSIKHIGKKKVRSSRGVAVGLRSSLTQGIKLFSIHKNLIWIRLNKMFFKTDQDIFLCGLYIPPQESPYFDQDIFNILETSISQFNHDGHTILAGDFNIRTGSSPDLIDPDQCSHIPGDISLPLDPLKKRKNFDSQINEHGPSLLDLCKSCDLRLLNGRTFGDSLGKITCHSAKGVSIVDYFIVSHELLNTFTSFIVKEPTVFSDHSQLIGWLKIGHQTCPHFDSPPKTQTFDLPRQFIWDENSQDKFLIALKHTDIFTLLASFEASTFVYNSDDVDLATEQLIIIIIDVCSRSLQIAQRRKKKKKSKLWFDKECNSARQYLHALSSRKFYDLINNLYSKSKCSIKTDDKRTEFLSYSKSVRQGCILSQILFNLYLNDISLLLDRDDTDPIILPNGTRLNSLFYADDLVLISKSADGLQNALSTLEKFCNEWLLSINLKKTKVMIFQKKCRKSTFYKYNFTIDSNTIEIVNIYTYLRVNFSSSGNFKGCHGNLKEKTRTSNFATRRYLNFTKLPLDINYKLFDSLFFPILLYGSEVWGVYDKEDLFAWEKDEIEKTHINFCKQTLGVNKQCLNVAARNEMGRLPLKLTIETSIIKFWIHLRNLQDTDIAKQCLFLSKELADRNLLIFD
ncbi:uncharacterized protein LOC111346174 [Stylophora pistillata]|uniref:uncharacterized protein LOC111346174 n=1 Tax=Stylophora pistillata TaxID=50429 RepID=UPI000C03A126|nr:uncharacterized protein LOC111346174 [Stylophora pistillata]